MANRIIKNGIKHCYDCSPDYNPSFPKNTDVDKTKSISELSDIDLRKLIERLRNEREAESVIRDLKRNSGEKYDYENPPKIDTKTPVDQLYHFGIIGQKWGVRRFQNKDGTRTPAGKKREEQFDKSEDHIKSRESKSKAPTGLTNDELRKLNERLQLEDTYKKLTTEKIDTGKSWISKAIKSGGDQALTEFSKGVFLGTAKLLVKQLSPSFAETAFNIKNTVTTQPVKPKKEKS